VPLCLCVSEVLSNRSDFEFIQQSFPLNVTKGLHVPVLKIMEANMPDTAIFKHLFLIHTVFVTAVTLSAKINFEAGAL
jgi:hypothetical protein